MKKLFLLFIFTISASALFAQESLKGKAEVYGFAGMAINDNRPTFTYNNIDFDTSPTDFSGGVGFMYNITNHFGLGIELMGQSLGSDTNERLTPNPYYIYVNDEITKSISLAQLFITGRVTVNPENKLRLYVPFGAGIGFYSARTTYTTWYYDYYYGEDVTLYDNSYFDSYREFAFYGGLGVEYTFGTFFLGLEGRYNVVPLPQSLTGTDKLRNIDVFLKLGVRFGN